MSIKSANDWVLHYSKRFPESIAMLGTSGLRDMFSAIQRDALETAEQMCEKNKPSCPEQIEGVCKTCCHAWDAQQIKELRKSL